MTMQRNVRPRPAAYDDDVDDAEDYQSELESADGESAESESERDPEMSDGEQEESEGEGENFEQQISNVSFGALKQAQDAISRKRKRGSDTTADQEDKLEALRARLRELKEAKSASNGKTKTTKSSKTPAKRTKHQDEEGSEDEEDDDSDSAPSEEGAPTKSRTSKHAPTAQSSKYQVSRKRIVVDVPKRVVRDPRFDAVHQHNAHPGNSEKAYSFLRDYQKSEISELKAAIKKTKNEDEKETLRRKLGSMENRLKAKEAKEREQEIIRRHRKEERDKIKQGKNPYYLKRKDIKEKALLEKFKGMKSKEREKLIDKRRRKEGQKEKKRMPDARRVTG